MQLETTLLRLALVLGLAANRKLRQVQALECCGASFQDSADNVAMETSYYPPPGRYLAVKVKVCTTEPFQIQIWRRLEEDVYQLRWRKHVNATMETASQGSLTIPISPLNVTSDDRLALFSPGNPLQKIPVPFSDDENSSVRLSVLSYERLETAANVTLREFRWRRTFRNYLRFCSTPSSCGDVDEVPPSQIPTKRPDFVTIPAKCCNQTEDASECNSTALGSLGRQRKVVRVLVERIIRLRSMVDSYLNGTRVTSYCPDASFVLGTGGVSHCYKLFHGRLQLAQAAMHCTGINARLVFVQDEAEDRFIKTLLERNLNDTSSDGLVRVWTSAIYSRTEGEWSWFNSMYPAETTRPFGAYTNWRDGTMPRSLGGGDVCAAYVLDPRTGRHYWEKAVCTEEHRFVCKTRKVCVA